MASMAKQAAAASVSAMVLATAFTANWEGLWLKAKVDTIGTGRPVTYCHGQTDEFGAVKVGTTFTKEQCSDLLKSSLQKYADQIAKCIRVPVSDKEFAAYVSFAYNIGSAGACSSSAFARLNRGDHRGACDALMNWTRAQGKVVKGLVNRRAAERKLCLDGANEKPTPKPSPVKAQTPWDRVKLVFNYILKG